MATVADPIQHIAAPEYHSRLALSNSGMKLLSISPLRFWFHEINPERPAKKETPQMQFGTALHCMVLEGDAEFQRQYTHAIEETDYDGCLVTADDMREWLRARGKKASGTRKAELIQQILDVDSEAPIWSLLEERHAANTEGKHVCKKEELRRILECAEALRREPAVRAILSDGEPEVSIFAEDPQTGVPLKGRLDWLAKDCILDLKTFTQTRGKSIDQTVSDAIWYEGYARQAYLYATIHKLVSGRQKPLKFVMAFVESDPPHEVRIRELSPSCMAGPNLYWQRSQVEVRHFCQLWAECMDKFGTAPWRSDRKIEPLIDEEIKALAY